MAGVFTHFQTLDAISQALPPQQRSLIETHPEYASFGSIGPDYLYFYKNDWGPLGAAGGVFFSLLDDMREILDVYNSTVSALENINDWLSGGASGDLQRNVDLIKAAVLSRVADLITKNVDFFEEFRPPISDRPDKGEIRNWWWADIAHQHRAMDFTRHLWSTSASDPRLRAYSLGFLSHVATDVVSHPYINLISGGPYRNHWRRHNLIERVYDTHFWALRMSGQEVTDSKCHRRIHFPSAAPARPDIPSELCQYLANAYANVYGSLNIASGIPNAQDIRQMYIVYYRYIQGATDLSSLNQPRPPEDFDWFDLDDWIQQKFNDVMARQPNFGRLPAINILDPRSWKAFLAALITYIIWLAELAAMIATLIPAAIARVSSVAVRYLLWQLSRVLHQLYDSARVALVISGYSHPTTQDVNMYFNSLVKPNLNFFLEKNFPHLHVTNAEQTYHLVHPIHVQPARDIRETPGVPLMQGDRAVLSDVDAVFFGSSGTALPSQLFTVCGGSTLPYISVTDLGVALIGKFYLDGGANLPNMNLDGDRGYGWPTWSAASNRPWSSLSDFDLCPAL